MALQSSMKLRYLLILLCFITTESFSDSCEGIATSCRFLPSGLNQCNQQFGCSSSRFNGQCEGNPTSCSRIPPASCNFQQGCVRVIDANDGTPSFFNPFEVTDPFVVIDRDRIEVLQELGFFHKDPVFLNILRYQIQISQTLFFICPELV